MVKRERIEKRSFREDGFFDTTRSVEEDIGPGLKTMKDIETFEPPKKKKKKG